MAYDPYRDLYQEPASFYGYNESRPPPSHSPPHPYSSPYDGRFQSPAPTRLEGTSSGPVRVPASPSIPSAGGLHPSYPPESQSWETSWKRTDGPPLNRPRAESAARPDPARVETPRYSSPPPRPVNEAVASAMGHVDTSGFDYPPELVDKVTEEVMKRMRATGLDKPTSPPPMRRTESGGSWHPSASSPAPPRIHHPTATRPIPESAIYGTLSSQGPPHSPTVPYAARDAPPGRPHERATPTVENSNPPPRPAVSRLFTTADENPLNKTWGQLFLPDGTATIRLSQLLRGLANHIIKDFEPQNSIVVTPTKMAKYYELYRLDSEPFFWDYLFKSLSNPELSHVYQELDCQHHLVQDQPCSTPCIPGLTAAGFERWMTILITASPDHEVVRLQKTVLEMPISNADNPRERFPKEISRQLFPKRGDDQAREKVRRAFPSAAQTSSNPSTSPPRPNTTADPTSAFLGNLERERHPYSGVPKEYNDDDIPRPPSQPPPAPRVERGRERPAEIDEDDQPLPPSTNLERERQPYVARPGGGRAYETETTKPSPFSDQSHGNNSNMPSSRTRPEGGRIPGAREQDMAPPPTEAYSRHRASSNVNAIRGDADYGRSDWQRWTGEEDQGRGYDRSRERERYDRGPDVGAQQRRGYEEDYYRPNGKTGYEYNQPYPPSYH